jgi:heptosyltransferase-2
MDEVGRALAPAPSRVLVKEVNWLGDLVMSLSALRAVRATFPDARLTVLIKQDLSEFFDGIGWVDQVLTYRTASGLGRLRRNWEVVRAIRKGSFDLAILFPNSFEAALWIALARVPQRAGYATDARGAMLTQCTKPTLTALSGHQSGYWLSMVRETVGAQASADASGRPFAPSCHHLRRVREWLGSQNLDAGRPLIAIAPAAAYGPAKEWPSERYAELIDRLTSEHAATCVIVGAASERVKCKQVAASTRSGALVAAGQLSLGDQIALLGLSNGFAGNDSGAMHLAAAIGIPTVGIFGSTNPVRTGPIGARATHILHAPPCNPCMARTCRFGHYDCLHAIAADEVVAALARLGAFAPRATTENRYETE